MFPFNMGNNYTQSQFPFGMTYPGYPPPYPNVNPYTFPYGYQNYVYQNQENLSGCHFKSSDLQDMNRNLNINYPLMPKVPHKKKLIKRLNNIQMKKVFSNLGKQFKQKKRTLKYFDPSRAPPISSLRNKEQLQLDLKNQLSKRIKLQAYHSQDNFSEQKNDNSLLKLQLLFEQPNKNDYPFLICKKRKYYRNLKRRYSVAYFQQRASYISNRQPIPLLLHPKNKIRKSRTLNRLEARNEDSELQSFSQSSQSSCEGFAPNHLEIKQKYQNQKAKVIQKREKIEDNKVRTEC